MYLRVGATPSLSGAMFQKDTATKHERSSEKFLMHERAGACVSMPSVALLEKVIVYLRS